MSLSYYDCFDPFDTLPPSGLSFFAFASSSLPFLFIFVPAALFFFEPVFASQLPIALPFEPS